MKGLVKDMYTHPGHDKNVLKAKGLGVGWGGGGRGRMRGRGKPGIISTLKLFNKKEKPSGVTDTCVGRGLPRCVPCEDRVLYV